MERKYFNKKAIFTSITLFIFLFLLIFKDNIKKKNKKQLPNFNIIPYSKYENNKNYDNIIISHTKKNKQNIFMTIKNK